MSISTEFATLFRRDLKRLVAQIEAITDDSILWHTPPGIPNSCGNLAMHLEGNLREYVGRQLGGIPYQRNRPHEFAGKDATAAELAARLRDVETQIPAIIEQLTADQLAAAYPEQVLGYEMTTGYFLVHLFGHLSYHLGQINYLRRLLSEAPPSSPSVPASA